jgi:cytidylate kinase
MILAIFGGSAVGKTTIAEVIGSRLGLPVRHCGVALRAAAVEEGVAMKNVDHQLHGRVDSDTVAWCERQSPSGGVVEGRFLNRVLAARSDVIFVHLTADLDDRASRLSDRWAQAVTPADVDLEDQADRNFVDKMYSSSPVGPVDQTLDTTGGTASQWAEKLESFARQRLGLEPD